MWPHANRSRDHRNPLPRNPKRHHARPRVNPNCRIFCHELTDKGPNTESLRTCQVLRPLRIGERSRCRASPVLPSATAKASASGIKSSFRSSMAGLCAPLPTLRDCPRAQARTARGRRGSLLLHRNGLPPPTLCRSPGAPPRLQGGPNPDQSTTTPRPRISVPGRLNSMPTQSRPSGAAIRVKPLLLRHHLGFRRHSRFCAIGHPSTRVVRDPRSLDKMIFSPVRPRGRDRGVFVGQAVRVG